MQTKEIYSSSIINFRTMEYDPKSYINQSLRVKKRVFLHLSYLKVGLRVIYFYKNGLFFSHDLRIFLFI